MSTETEAAFDEAVERMVTATDHIPGVGPRQHRGIMEFALRALLSDSVPCETCGIGTVYGVQPGGQIKCPDCNGTGSRPSVAVLRADLELVEWRRPNREWSTWEHWTPEHPGDTPEGDGWEPLYRISISRLDRSVLAGVTSRLEGQSGLR